MFYGYLRGNAFRTVRNGYTMMAERTGPCELVGDGVAAEEGGFGFSVTTDHRVPRPAEQGHAPYAWAVPGAAGAGHLAHSRIGLTTYVNCPTVRHHPTVVARKAATVQILAEGRFRLGLGSGENLDEHVVGGGRPAVPVRLETLEESVRIIRPLLEGRPPW